MSILQIEQKIKQLPDYLLPEIVDYVDFLLHKYSRTTQAAKTFTFDWEGGLAQLCFLSPIFRCTRLESFC